jgi:deferrochelatase/peroxidase EfeB
MSRVDYTDVQGLLRFGYTRLTDARLYLMRIRDQAAARAWLASAPVSTAEVKSPPPTRALQVAFTASGLRSLGVREQVVASFSPEFVNGMVGEPNRSHRLGDTGDNDPSKWLWGGPKDRIDLLVILLAAPGEMAGWQQQVCNADWSRAFEGDVLNTSDLNGREPFGFIDGISQPELDWEGRRDTSQDQIDYTNLVSLGEFVLGYLNEYGKYTERPLLDPDDAGASTLLPSQDDPGKRDLGRHGTYLVLRQLEQDVTGFWNFVNRQNGSYPGGKALAEALVGRRLDDGSPLVPLSADAIEGIPEAAGEPGNRFTYREDAEGLRCPFGAHIRRANPRNSDFPGRPSGIISRTLTMLGAGAPGFHDDLIASTRFHRLLRRGREYGRPGQDPGPAGLHFVCLNASISRQFEFVQNAWIVSGKFNGLPDESDPLLGAPEGRFSIPREGKCPARVTEIPRFITVRGGAYFFLPGIRAIRYFARAV